MYFALFYISRFRIYRGSDSKKNLFLINISIYRNHYSSIVAYFIKGRIIFIFHDSEFIVDSKKNLKKSIFNKYIYIEIAIIIEFIN